MGDDVNRMTIREFRDLGYLQEVNRAFFHPHGLALEVEVDEDGAERLGGVWDYRDDPEGMVFGDLSGATAATKAEAVRAELEKHRAPREKLLGSVIQPIGSVVPRP